MSTSSSNDKVNLLIGVTGSVATIKLPKLIKQFREQFKLKFVDDRQLEIRVVMTEHSGHFVRLDDENVLVYRDKDEWENWQQMSDPVLHIELRNWATALLVAPLDANTLAKLANGLCDNLLTCIVRAWNLDKPLLYAPAMNTYMYMHPYTSEHIGRLNRLGYLEIPVIEKRLACGDTGLGAMAETEQIVEIVLNKI